ncbi:MAG: elongation factor G [Alphaproteobacteria bacterium]|nr:MAG: elongation factor G [Alphaproteobacteria bacterium]
MASASTGETRVVGLMGPFHSGKTTLLESILAVTGSLHRKSANGQRVFGDTSPESKAREMGIDLNIATTDYLGERYSFLDCPGSVELVQECLNIVPALDAAIIVTEPDESRILALAPLFKTLEDAGVPRFVLVNKVDRANGSVRELVAAFNRVSATPVLLRHIPVREKDAIVGYADLASERCYLYRPGAESEIVPLPADLARGFEDERYKMLETLADFDDHLMEELLEDIAPPRDEVFADLAKDVADGLIVPVFLGSALHDQGTRRLLKALRHEMPSFATTCARLGVDTSRGQALAYVIRTFHTPHAGKLSVSRLLRGRLRDGDMLNGERVSGLFTINGQQPEKIGEARAGDIVGLGRLERARTGDSLSAGDGTGENLPRPVQLAPVYSLALQVDNRQDEVKLSGALAKMTDEDPALSFRHDPETGELLLMGQGEMHLLIAVDRLRERFGIAVSTRRPQVPYKETIRKGTRQHSRFKKQSGGHGQFGDVVIEISPLPAGTGFAFEDKIHGGAIPRQYIPSVEAGIRDYLKCGPLGFPVVDVGVALLDGKHHSVDSSDMAFQTAGRMAMSEALPACNPVLLEPIMHVAVHVPNEYTAKVNSIISSRRGQILGYDARPGWLGWDTVEAHMPQSETQDLIIELRSLTQGAGTFDVRFDHLNELSGRDADAVIAQRKTQIHS